MPRIEEQYRADLVEALAQIVSKEDGKALTPKAVEYLKTAIYNANCRDLVGLISLTKALIRFNKKHGKKT